MGILSLVFATGCQQAQLVGEPLTAAYSSSELESQMEFWHQLSERTIVSNDEAFHAVLLFVDSDDPAGSYDERVELLKSRGMLRGDFDAPSSQAVTRGDLAVTLMRGMGIRGGVMARLFPQSPRYATRELAYLNIYPVSSPHQTFTGPQLLGVIAVAEDYQAKLAAEGSAGESAADEEGGDRS
ncbi:MAG: hypothetical protein ACYTGQ_01410 [Planctomycetota bacterium]